MATPYLSLEGVSYVLPNGETILSDLNENFDQLHTGLVGRNGCGKSVLARILADQIQPTRGRCVRAGTVHYLPQQISAPAGATVADLAGVQHSLHALRRIEEGSAEPADFDVIGDQWDIRQQFLLRLAEHGLGHLNADAPAHRLSGGECMRLALIGAQLSNADFLILDEPTNHLDQSSRLGLIAWLQRWQRGLLVISHDRQLLGCMARMVQLSSLGLRSYGGNYTFYATVKAQEQKNAIDALSHAKRDRRREEQAMQAQRERAQKRQARGARHAKHANQAKVLLGQQRERSEQSMGKLHKQQTEAQLALSHRVNEAAAQVAEDPVIHLHDPFSPGDAKRVVVELDNVALPFVPEGNRTISLLVTGQQRIGVLGRNGCGKSSLLKVLAGALAPLAGTLKVTERIAYLDQGLSLLDATRPVLEQAQAANPSLSDSALRTRLAHLGLGPQKLAIPCASLSGGERLKAALACVLYAHNPPELLLLDEPSNHLDLPSLQALEQLLSNYPGALVVVSHDHTFLAELGLTDLLVAGPAGWSLFAADHLGAWKAPEMVPENRVDDTTLNKINDLPVLKNMDFPNRVEDTATDSDSCSPPTLLGNQWIQRG